MRGTVFMKKSIAIIMMQLILMPMVASCAKKENETAAAFQIDGGNKTSVYPVVQNAVVGDKQVEMHSVNLCVSDGADKASVSLLRSELEKREIEIEETSPVTLYIGSTESLSEELAFFTVANESSACSIDESKIEKIETEEGYAICAGANKIVLAGNNSRGCYYAVVSFLSLIKNKAVNECVIVDYPSVKLRGIVEGFYGKPWTHQDRLSMIEFLGSVKMNTYIYAPKDDLKHRDEWRVLYEGEAIARFKELIETSRQSHVDFVFAISPGLDFNFGGGYKKDFEALIKKCNQLYDLGIRDFAVLLDDIVVRKRTPTGHARLINDFQKKFCDAHDDVSDVITVFSEYYNTVITPEYTDIIGRSLDKRAKVMWTGESPSNINIKEHHMKNVNKKYGRNMMIWWNYPVNDYYPNGLFIGPAVGLDKNLSDSISGFVSNPMNQSEASKIPFFTIADYLWNTKSYSPASSYRAALEFSHPETADSLKKVCDIVCANLINANIDSIEYKNAVSNFTAALSSGKDISTYSKELSELLEKLSKAADYVRENEPNKAFLEDISPWLDKAKAYAEMGICAAKALQSKDRSDIWDEYVKYIENKKSIEHNFTIVSGRVLAPMFPQIEGYMNAYYNKDSDSPELKMVNSWADAEISGSNIPTYQNYVIENATDGNDDTCYWWQGPTPKGSYVMLDLGKVTHVYNIMFKSGACGHTEDYFRSGRMQYSEDGVNWTDIGEVMSEANVIMNNLDFNARYVRYVLQEKQDFWLCLSVFHVNYESEAEEITGLQNGIINGEADKMFDGNLLTSYIPKSVPQKGEEMNIRLKDISASNIEILQQTLSGAKVVACFADGSEKQIAELDNYCNTALLPENTVSLKLIWQGNEILPSINEIIYK